MDEAAIGLIGGGLGTVARVLYMARFSGRLAIGITAVLGGVLTYLFALQYKLWNVDHAFDLAVGYLDVLAVAAGAFHLWEELPKAVNNPDGLLRKMTGTGDVTPKP